MKYLANLLKYPQKCKQLNICVVKYYILILHRIVLTYDGVGLYISLYYISCINFSFEKLLSNEFLWRLT